MSNKKLASLLLVLLLVLLMILQVQPAFAADPTVVDGRTLAKDRTGDTSAWIEIARYEDYSLIIRQEPLTNQPSRYNSTMDNAYASSLVRKDFNDWYNYRLSATAKLRDFAVTNNAMNHQGSYGTEYVDGISIPLKVAAPKGDDIAFALSFCEAAFYCSTQHITRWVDQPIVISSTAALNNYHKLLPKFVAGGATPAYWLRTPGTSYLLAGSVVFQGGAGWPGAPYTYEQAIGRVNQDTVIGVFGHYRPAMWVGAGIFEDTVSLTYNANGGTGAPPTQTGIPINTYATISSTTPTRFDNAPFLGWATSSTATVAQYQPGGTIYMSSNITLFAVWQQQVTTTVSLTYNANGGSGAPPAQTDIPINTYATISSTTPTRSDNAPFLGWATSPTATVAQYQPGGAIYMNSNITLFAVWQQQGEGGRILPPNKTGDIVNWLEIKREGNYSLIVRTSYINIYTQANRYGDPTWQYTAYGSTSAYSSSNVRNRINEWFNGTAPAAADNLPAIARLRSFTVQHNALSVLGTCCNPNASMTDGLSNPNANKAGNGNDIAFALSYSESASYCSLTHFMRLMNPSIQPSSAIAVANYNKITIPSIYIYGMWLRSPGDVAGTAGSLSNPTDFGRAFQMQLFQSAGSERGLVYPALWVESAIFDDDEFTLSYDANGGTGAPPSQTAPANTYATISSIKPTLDYNTFLGWATSPTATTPQYQPGDSILMSNDVKLFAVWGEIQTRTISGRVYPMATVDVLGSNSGFLQMFDVVVELRTTFLTPAPAALSTKAELMNVLGVGQFTLENVPFGDYVLYIKRPGYLARPMLVTVNSSSPQVITLEPPGTADNGIFRLWPGDCNDDGLIDNLDFIIILNLAYEHVNALHLNYLPYCDLNADGVIDTQDFNLAFANFGKNPKDYPGAEGVDPLE